MSYQWRKRLVRLYEFFEADAGAVKRWVLFSVFGPTKLTGIFAVPKEFIESLHPRIVVHFDVDQLYTLFLAKRLQAGEESGTNSLAAVVLADDEDLNSLMDKLLISLKEKHPEAGRLAVEGGGETGPLLDSHLNPSLRRILNLRRIARRKERLCTRLRKPRLKMRNILSNTWSDL